MAARKDSLDVTARHLNSAAIHLLRGLRAADRASGVSAARLSALSVLVFGGPRTLGELARAEDVTSPTMTRIVDGLVELGLAARDPHPDSARQVLVSPTPDGEHLMHDAAQLRVDVIVSALRQLPTEDRRVIASAAPLLRELSSRVSATRPPASRRAPRTSRRKPS
jgi:DNA-binding MarR family transcriptional regulator